MKKEFLPYEQALELKELGFDEPCFGRYYYKESYPMLNPNLGETELVFEFGQYIKQTEITILAPTFSQAFRFFREKYGFEIFLQKEINLLSGKTYSYLIENDVEEIIKRSLSKSGIERAELECLKKLIEIVKNK
jgi:hypothetical protein